MDWELLGLTLLFAAPGLIAGIVGVLGFTRTEKVLGVAYYAGFATLLVVINILVSSDIPDLRTKADIDSWLARMHTAHRFADCISWFCVAMATAFCVVAVTHIWRERTTLWKKSWVKT